MRWSRTFIPTLRQDPSDAEPGAPALMIRAGLVRKLSAGVYSYLPLGWRALLNAVAIVRDEMDRAGAAELLMPMVHPAELWQETGRFELFGPILAKFKDRNGHLHVLGPTHEEVITHIVRNEVSSHRQMPVTLYQIQTKFRDEARPRFGVIRTREFMMKDAYSFDATTDGLDQSYRKQYDAYVRIFKRGGVPATPVEADTGLIGGDVSHEFMAPASYGEDLMARCKACGYAANKEKVECRPAASGPGLRETLELEPHKEVATPGRSTIEQVCEFLKVPPDRLIKTLVVKSGATFVAALVRGDHELNLAKLAKAANLTAPELASAEEIQAATGGPLGFSGPVGLKIPVYADLAVERVLNSVVGANKRDAHLVNVSVNRDYRPAAIVDLRLAQAGDACPKCQKALEFTTCIEVGHVFKLGTKYSEKMKATFSDEAGAVKPIVMGCYGIGVNRIVAAAVENHRDEKGIQWPRELAPYDVHVVSLNHKDAAVVASAAELEAALEKAGLDVLWDDRDASAGVKFSDADMVGMPLRLTVGSRGVKAGTVDLRSRATGEEKPVPAAQVVDAVRQALQNYPF